MILRITYLNNMIIRHIASWDTNHSTDYTRKHQSFDRLPKGTPIIRQVAHGNTNHSTGCSREHKYKLMILLSLTTDGHFLRTFICLIYSS